MSKRLLISSFASLFLLALILRYPNWSHVFATLSNLSLSIFIALFLLQTTTILLSVYIWHSLLKREISFCQVLRIYLTGSFMESITPAVKLGGELVKVYLFSKLSSLSSQELMKILFFQKYVSLLPFMALCILALIPGFFFYSLPPLVYIALFVSCLLFSLFFFQKKNREGEERGSWLPSPLKKIAQARENWSSIQSASQRRRLLLISTMIWLLYPAKVYLVAKSLQALTDPLHSSISTFSAYVISMIPLLPGGVGSFEGSLAFFFTLSGNPYTKGLAIALTSRLITFYFPLIVSSLAAISMLHRMGPKALQLKSIEGGMHG